MFKGPLEDTLPMLHRRRVLQQLDLAFAELTATQSAAVDEICNMLTPADVPMPLDTIPIADRPEAHRLLRLLPTTHFITRFLEGR
ncbi:MAG: hypothetical protein WD851_19585 [Pirellulales bacterium]